MIFSGNGSRHLPLAILLLVLVLCGLGGGASRGDVLSLLYLRPALVLAVAAFLLLPARTAPSKGPLIFLAALALIILLQLLPLPPALWTALPGHEVFAEAATTAGVPQPWRPISIDPDSTWNSLLALLPALAILLGASRIERGQWQIVLLAVAGIGAFSVLVGLIQLSTGGAQSANLYRIAHTGWPAGLFANRNHQAAFLSLLFPLLRVWTLLPAGRLGRRPRVIVAAAGGLVLIPMILATGSRAGIFLAALGIAGAALLPIGLKLSKRRGKGVRRPEILVAGLLVVVLALMVVFGRSTSFDRLLGGHSLEAEQRVQMAPVTLGLARQYFPTGSGFGTFDPAFRVAEPDSALHAQYFNHAHNDLIELLVTGGLFGALLLLAALVWIGLRLPALWRGDGQPGAILLGRCGLVMTGVLLAGSLADYPLRTPLLTAIFALAMIWVAQATDKTSGEAAAAFAGEEKSSRRKGFSSREARFT